MLAYEEAQKKYFLTIAVADFCYSSLCLLLKKIKPEIFYKFCDFLHSGNAKRKILLVVLKKKCCLFLFF